MNHFERMLGSIKTDYVCIQTHKFPDPDAISCAYALQELLKAFHITSSIYYGGMLDKSTNKRMLSYLGADMTHTDDADLEQAFDVMICVDSQAGNGNSSALNGKVSLCIDHHPRFNDVIYDYEDIRPAYGACATIITQYYIESGIPINERIATGLVYGIQIDTNNFTRGTTIEDIDAYRALFPLCNHNFLNELHNSQYDRKGIEAYAHALNHLEFKDEICFVDVGMDCPETLAAAISDFALAIEDVKVALVYAKRKDGIKFSMRSVSLKYDTGILMYGILHGLGQGGGHSLMAGGFIPYQEDMDVEMSIRQIKDKLIWLVERICV